MKPAPFVECSVCGRAFGTKSIVIHERQCLSKLRRTEIDPSPNNLTSQHQELVKKKNNRNKPTTGLVTAGAKPMGDFVISAFGKSNITMPTETEQQRILPRIQQHRGSNKERPSTVTLSRPKILNLDFIQYDMSLTKIETELPGQKQDLTRISNEPIFPLVSRSTVGQGPGQNKGSRKVKLPESNSLFSTFNTMLGDQDPFKKSSMVHRSPVSETLQSQGTAAEYSVPTIPPPTYPSPYQIHAKFQVQPNAGPIPARFVTSNLTSRAVDVQQLQMDPVPAAAAATTRKPPDPDLTFDEEISVVFSKSPCRASSASSSTSSFFEQPEESCYDYIRPRVKFPPIPSTNAAQEEGKDRIRTKMEHFNQSSAKVDHEFVVLKPAVAKLASSRRVFCGGEDDVLVFPEVHTWKKVAAEIDAESSGSEVDSTCSGSESESYQTAGTSSGANSSSTLSDPSLKLPNCFSNCTKTSTSKLVLRCSAPHLLQSNVNQLKSKTKTSQISNNISNTSTLRFIDVPSISISSRNNSGNSSREDAAEDGAEVGGAVEELDELTFLIQEKLKSRSKRIYPNYRKVADWLNSAYPENLQAGGAGGGGEEFELPQRPRPTTAPELRSTAAARLVAPDSGERRRPYTANQALARVQEKFNSNCDKKVIDGLISAVFRVQEMKKTRVYKFTDRMVSTTKSKMPEKYTPKPKVPKKSTPTTRHNQKMTTTKPKEPEKPTPTPKSTWASYNRPLTSPPLDRATKIALQKFVPVEKRHLEKRPQTSPVMILKKRPLTPIVKPKPVAPIRSPLKSAKGQGQKVKKDVAIQHPETVSTFTQCQNIPTEIVDLKSSLKSKEKGPKPPKKLVQFAQLHERFSPLRKIYTADNSDIQSVSTKIGFCKYEIPSHEVYEFGKIPSEPENENWAHIGSSLSCYKLFMPKSMPPDSTTGIDLNVIVRRETAEGHFPTVETVVPKYLKDWMYLVIDEDKDKDKVSSTATAADKQKTTKSCRVNLCPSFFPI